MAKKKDKLSEVSDDVQKMHTFPVDPIEFLVAHGGKPEWITWDELGKVYGVNYERIRARWRRYRLSKVTVSGSKILKTYSYTPESSVEKEGLIVDKVTTNPWGGEWVKYKKRGLTKNEKEDLIKVIKDALSGIKIPKLHSKHIDNSDPSSGNHILAIGDVHIGMKRDDNTWNRELLFERAEKVVNDVCCLSGTITVIFGGDLNDGHENQTTRRHHNLPQNMDSKEQLKTSFEFCSYIIENLSKKLKVNVIFVANSNHGGIIEYATGFALSYVFENVALQTEYIKLHNVYGCDLVITHGYDESNRKRPLPRFLKPEDIMYVMSCVGKMNFTMLRFDLHQSHYVKYSSITDILCPAFAPASEYIRHNYPPSEEGYLILENWNPIFKTF